MKKKNSLQKKLMSVLFFISIMFLCLVFVIIDFIFLSEEIRDYRKDAQTRIEALVDSINENFDSILDQSNNIAQNQFIIDILISDPGENMSVIMENYAFIKKLFDVYTEYGKSITSQLKIYPANERFPSGQYIFKLSDLKEKPVWEKVDALQVYEAAWEYMTEEGIPYISLYRKISSFRDTVGYLEINIPFYDIKSLIEETELKSGELIVYLSQTGNNIYHSTDDSITNGLQITGSLLNGDKVTLTADWHFVLKRYFIYTGIFILIFAALLFCVYFLCKYIIFSITKEMQDFIEMLRKDENLLYLEKPPGDEEAEDEISIVKNKFYNLILEIKQVHGKLEKINREKKKVELEYLQMCFNPHLLYNTLSAISWSFYQNGQQNMRSLVGELSSYYRSVLSGGSNIIPIRKEIELIKQYLKIVQTSYNRKITFVTECDDDILDYYIIKQLLQPIVENAVLHGTSDLEETQISIKIYKESNDIVFIIYNDGRSITEEEIEKAMHGSQNGSGRRGYGILNTINRIKTYYGNQYGLDIRSVPQGGTEVVVRIECLDQEVLALRM